jgi:secreted PhoX family phosphatase
MRQFNGYGPLQPDPSPERLLDLPTSFSYRQISCAGERMTDGHFVPDNADGMGAFQLDNRRMILVRNHELAADKGKKGPFSQGAPEGFDLTKAFDSFEGQPLPGGTTTIIYDWQAGTVLEQNLSLVGTIRNCAGGVTPWGSWLTCEEDVSGPKQRLSRDHGWVFEVPAGRKGLVQPVPLQGLGRFKHEAAAVDPDTGIVYLTEDQTDSLFYRFVPERRGELARGGTLEALALAGSAEGIDSRNWSGTELRLGVRWPIRWVRLEKVTSPGRDDLRIRGHALGATRFANGEGLHFGRNEFGQSEFFFCCTSGGAIKRGQIMRYVPSRWEGRGHVEESSAPGTLELFVESTDPAELNYGDNLTVAPNGHLIVCEDAYVDYDQTLLPREYMPLGLTTGCYIRGVTPAGAVYKIAHLHGNTELAGVCFSPDGKIMFVNVYSPAKTLAITGPWHWDLPPRTWSVPRASLQ